MQGNGRKTKYWQIEKVIEINVNAKREKAKLFNGLNYSAVP
jgi:hypothetical protein